MRFASQRKQFSAVSGMESHRKRHFYGLFGGTPLPLPPDWSISGAMRP
jgi:hypothetical protein